MGLVNGVFQVNILMHRTPGKLRPYGLFLRSTQLLDTFSSNTVPIYLK